MTTEIQTLPAFTEIAAHSKSDLSAMATQLVTELAEGGRDVLAVLSLAAKLRHYASEVERAAKVAGVRDLSLYGKEGVTKSGVRLSLRESGVTYDYSRDEEWNEINAELDALHEKLCEREKLLKALPVEGKAICDPVTGEWCHAMPPIKTAREGVTATIL